MSRVDADQVISPSPDSDSEGSEIIKVNTPSLADSQRRILLVLPETNVVIRTLLSMIYPGLQRPTFKDLDEQAIDDVLVTARKYKMVSIIEELCMKLIDVANSKSTNPDRPLALRVYAISTSCKMYAVATMAARATLRGRGFEKYVPDLELVTGGDYFRLVNYYRKCTDAVLRITWSKNLRDLISCKMCASAGDASSEARWWKTYAASVREILRGAPGSERIYDLCILQPAIKEAMQCNSCSDSLLKQWPNIQSCMEKDIDMAVSNVSGLCSRQVIFVDTL